MKQWMIIGLGTLLAVNSFANYWSVCRGAIEPVVRPEVRQILSKKVDAWQRNSLDPRVLMNAISHDRDLTFAWLEIRGEDGRVIARTGAGRGWGVVQVECFPVRLQLRVTNTVFRTASNLSSPGLVKVAVQVEPRDSASKRGLLANALLSTAMLLILGIVPRT